MAEKLGEGYIEIFGMDAKFNASLRQVQSQLDSTIARAKTAQGAVASASGFGSSAIANARRAMGMSSGGYAFASGRGTFSGPGIGGGYGPGLVSPKRLTGGYAVAAGYGPAGAAAYIRPNSGYALARGFGPSGATFGYAGDGGFPPTPTSRRSMGIFGPGLNASLVKRYSKMPHPTMPGLNALGKPMPGGGGDAEDGDGLRQVGGVGLYKQLAGLYAAKVAGDEFLNSVKRGSDMIETLQKTREVFGAATGSVTNMADEMASKFGSNKQVMLDTASVFGLIGQAAKMSEIQSAGMAVSMSKLAADASSFYNVPLDVALVKIQAGLVGQSRPLREFGVLLNIATVKAKALEMGFKTLNGQFSEPDKILARAQLIKEGLAKASGDMERTLDSPANVMRRLEGDWENAKTEFGMPLASVGASMALGARKEVTEAFKSLKASTGSEAIAGFASLYAVIPGALRGLMEDESKTNARMGVDSRMMTRAEIKVESPMEKFYRERQAYDQFISDKHMRENNVAGAGGGPFGMFGNLGLMMANEAMTGDIDKKINRVQKQQDQWGGGHVTDPLSFMRDAQERILTPMDETAKEQLAELKAIREVLESKEGSQGGMILRGREN